MLVKFFKLVIKVVILSLFYGLILLASTPFLVSWGAPKPLWFTFFYSFPFNVLEFYEDHLFDFILLNSFFWGVVTISLWKLLKYLKNTS